MVVISTGNVCNGSNEFCRLWLIIPSSVYAYDLCSTSRKMMTSPFVGLYRDPGQHPSDNSRLADAIKSSCFYSDKLGIKNAVSRHYSGCYFVIGCEFLLRPPQSTAIYPIAHMFWYRNEGTLTFSLRLRAKKRRVKLGCELVRDQNGFFLVIRYDRDVYNKASTLLWRGFGGVMNQSGQVDIDMPFRVIYFYEFK